MILVCHGYCIASVYDHLIIYWAKTLALGSWHSVGVSTWVLAYTQIYDCIASASAPASVIASKLSLSLKENITLIHNNIIHVLCSTCGCFV